MDKWDHMIETLIQSAAEKDEKKAIRVAVDYFAEIGRTLELIGSDIDRLAFAAEHIGRQMGNRVDGK